MDPITNPAVNENSPLVLKWLQALQGQDPGFKLDPAKSGLENYGNALTGVLPAPVVAGYKNIFGLPFGLGASASPTTPTPALSPVPAMPTPGLTMPVVPTKTSVGGGPQDFSFPGGPELPAPPMIPAPPQAKIPGGGNYANVKALADKGKPGALDQASLDKARVADILGGLASGAGSVPATEAGSFARALAASGAGGSKGVSTGAVRQVEMTNAKDLQNQNFYQHRAGLEKDIVSAQAAQANAAAQVAFHNADLVWKTNIANQNAQYEFLTKKLQLEQPQIKHDANGISITQMDPATRQWNMRVIPTKPVFESLDKMDSVFKALGQNVDAAKAANIQFIGNQYKNDPVGGREVMKRLAVKDLIDNGAGSTVFGQAFQKAATAAKTELEAIPGLQAKPAEYMSELNSRITARILSMPEVSSNLTWAQRGVAHSPYARVLAGSP